MANKIYDPKSATSYLNIDVTAQYAVEAFAKENLEEMIACCGFTPEEGGFSVHFIDHDVMVQYPSGEVTLKETGEPVSVVEKILILHHAVYSEGGILVKDKISYKELPSGDIYIDPFTNRCIKALTGIFASNLELLKKAVAHTIHEDETYGDYSCTIQVLPKVPITLIVYEEDDEFPASGNVLFNAAAARFLHTEDYNQITAFLISSLKKIAFA